LTKQALPLVCGVCIPQHTSAYGTSAYVNIRQHTSAYVSIRHFFQLSEAPGNIEEQLAPSIRQHTSAYVSMRQHTYSIPGNLEEQLAPSLPEALAMRRRLAVCALKGTTLGTIAYVSIRQHTSAYVSILQHTAAYVSIRQHTSAYVSRRTACVGHTEKAGGLRAQGNTVWQEHLRFS
jgi:hypothetical protein